MATHFQPLVPCLLVLVLCAGTGCTAPLVATDHSAPARTEFGTVTDAPVDNATSPRGAKSPARGAVGLGAGALIGDQVEAQEKPPPEQKGQPK